MLVFNFIKNIEKNIDNHITLQITNWKKFYIISAFIKMESNDKLKETDIKNRTCCYMSMT